MKKILFGIFCSFISLFPLFSEPVSISGLAPEYSGTEIVFLKYADWITYHEEVVARVSVDDNGNYSAEFDLSETELIFVYLGIYRAYFYAEPGNSYGIILPSYVARSYAEILNPYFRYTDIHLGINNVPGDDLNVLIMGFEDIYNPLYDKFIENIYQQANLAIIEDEINNIEKEYQEIKHNFFDDYRNYRYGLLKMMAFQQRSQGISDEYFNNYPVLYNNPAYNELFNQVFDKYFVFFGRTSEGGQIYTDINRYGSYRKLLNSLSGNINFSNDTLQELVILKQIYDEYYSDQFSRSGLLYVLDTLIASTRISKHIKIGVNIKNKLTSLQPGYEPPFFELEDSEGILRSLSDYTGSYIYLNFCTCQSYTCLNEFNVLASLHKSYEGKLRIITVTMDPNDEELARFRLNNDYNWTFLHYDNYPEVLKEYDIRAFPTYFLIGPDGKLILSPAPSPSENFEQRLFEIMRDRGDLYR